MEKLMGVSERSWLAKWVKTFPMGYETVLSQSGGNISRGQKQLILLTAAMATEKNVLLLDEAFANLDWLSRSEILQGEWFEGKTVVYASHEGGYEDGVSREITDTSPDTFSSLSQIIFGEWSLIYR